MFQEAGHGPAIRYGYHLTVLRPNTGGRLAQARARALQSRQCLDHSRMHVHSFLQTAEVAPPRRMRLRPGWLWCTIRPLEAPMNTRFLLTTLGGAALCALALVPLAAQSTPARTFTPVTDAMLRNPSPDDWLHWR